ncbi:MAG TPA: hypothetical protein VGJ20_34205 [Xanthobacteraceae bacterium]
MSAFAAGHRGGAKRFGRTQSTVVRDGLHWSLQQKPPAAFAAEVVFCWTAGATPRTHHEQRNSTLRAKLPTVSIVEVASVASHLNNVAKFISKHTSNVMLVARRRV